jgi:hypothetical protein
MKYVESKDFIIFMILQIMFNFVMVFAFIRIVG